MIQCLILPLSQLSVSLPGLSLLAKAAWPPEGKTATSPCPDSSFGCSRLKPCQIHRITILFKVSKFTIGRCSQSLQLGEDFNLCWLQVKILLLFLGPRNTKLLIGSNLVWLVIPGVPFAGAVALLKGLYSEQTFQILCKHYLFQECLCVCWSFFIWPMTLRSAMAWP